MSFRRPDHSRAALAVVALVGALGLPAVAVVAAVGCDLPDTTTPSSGDALTCTLGAEPPYATLGDALDHATAGQEFSAIACDVYDYTVYTSGPHAGLSVFYYAATGVLAADVTTTPDGGPACEGPPEFVLPSDCLATPYVAVGAGACTALVYSDTTSCDACLNTSCCNELDFCATATTSCGVYVACLATGEPASTCATTSPEGPVFAGAVAVRRRELPRLRRRDPALTASATGRRLPDRLRWRPSLASASCPRSLRCEGG